jgi:hypothetical protein
LDATSLPQGTYYVWVDAVGGSPATFDISLVLGTAIPPPSNDICSTADTLVLGTPTNGTTSGAADDYDLSCVATDFRDTAHKFNLVADSSVLVEVAPTTAWEPATALRAGTMCAAPDLYCTDGALASRFINVPSLSSGDYSVIVDGVDGASGDYTINVTATTPVDATYGYKLVRTTAPYASIDTAPGKTSLTVADTDRDVFFNVALPFGFTYFGMPYTDVNVSSNGYLRFGAGTETALQSRTNTCPMDNGVPNNMIAVFWDDHYASTVDNANRLSYLTDGVAPHRRFIVEWFDWDLVESEPCQGQCDTILATNVTHQVILHENGDIEMHYGPRVAPLQSHDCDEQHLGCSATIGLKNSDGGDIDLADCSNSTVAADDVIYFVHPTSAP